jgi:hypothetical protein
MNAGTHYGTQLCLNHTRILYLYNGLADAVPYTCSNLRAVVRGEESVMQEESHAHQHEAKVRQGKRIVFASATRLSTFVNSQSLMQHDLGTL